MRAVIPLNHCTVGMGWPAATCAAVLGIPNLNYFLTEQTLELRSFK